MRLSTIRPRFVDFIPRELEEGVLYISEKYRTVSHKCACGCGEKVVTPLSPADWQLRKDGELVTLSPSIGNWNYPCHSHYWIRRNRIQWAAPLTSRDIARVQKRDLADKARYVDQINRAKGLGIDSVGDQNQNKHPEPEPASLTLTILSWLRRLLG